VLGATYPRYRSLLLVLMAIVVLTSLVLWYRTSRTGTRIQAMVATRVARALGIPCALRVGHVRRRHLSRGPRWRADRAARAGAAVHGPRPHP
jgi:hypothetical protein